MLAKISLSDSLSLSPSSQEIDLKAGGGYTTTIGEMCRMLLTKLDWFGTLVPRIPVHVSKDLQQRVNELEPIGYGFVCVFFFYSFTHPSILFELFLFLFFMQ